MAEQPSPVVPPVTDHRPVPKGVIPRGFQTWLMVAIALGILLIIFVAGEPEPPQNTTQVATAPPAPNPDRLREYQDRLRAMEARQALGAQSQAPAPAVFAEPQFAQPSSPPPEDPIAADRRRREYESLFASNVVSSRRPEPDRIGLTPTAQPRRRSAVPEDPGSPSLDEVAEAVVRAVGRDNPSGDRAIGLGDTDSIANSGQQPAVPASSAPVADGLTGTLRERRPTPDHTGPISAAGPRHLLLEGTVIDTVLTNRLESTGAAPVNCLVTNPVYSHSGQHVLIPAGARVLGETRPVQSLGETRLAVGFHRLLMPDGSTRRLAQFLGLNQVGDAGLRDKVNQHYLSTFGSAGAVGLISGLAQWIGTAGLARSGSDRTVIIAGGAADGASQASLQVMNRFLNRLPTVTIREGHRVKVYLTGDLELPAYTAIRRGAARSQQ